jgi:predicted regulator of Ras-like GTPase activity (Roadblock/LC7/MglB family)
MTDGYLVVTSISRGSVLGVIAGKSANLATVAYEMTLFGSRAGAALTPGLIAELKSAART